MFRVTVLERRIGPSIRSTFCSAQNSRTTTSYHVWLSFIHITESQIVVAKVDDDETEHRRRAKLWRELGVVSFIFEREEGVLLFLYVLYILTF